MGVYIKNMKMPGACLACDFCNPFAEEPYCRRLMKITPKTTTLPDCPLIEAEESEYCSQKEHRPVLYPNTSPQRWERNEEQDEWKRLKE